MNAQGRVPKMHVREESSKNIKRSMSVSSTRNKLQLAIQHEEF